MIRAIFDRLRALAREDATMLFGFLAVALLGFVFLKLASEMLEGETLALDRQLLGALRSLDGGTGWFGTAMRDATALGSATVLTLVTLLAAGFLLSSRKPAAAAFLAFAIGLGALLAGLLKLAFARPRPEFVAHLVDASGASFPSGHAMNSAVVYLTLGALLARAERRRLVRLYLIGAAILLAVLVGVSRVYLGVHWPSDVVAGWCVGAAWALGCALAVRALQRARRVEPAEG